MGQYAIPKNAFFIWEPPEGPYMKPYSYSILHITPYLSYSIVYTAGWEGCWEAHLGWGTKNSFFSMIFYGHLGGPKSKTSKTKVVSMVTRYPPKKFQTPHMSQYAVPKNAFRRTISMKTDHINTDHIHEDYTHKDDRTHDYRPIQPKQLLNNLGTWPDQTTEPICKYR